MTDKKDKYFSYVLNTNLKDCKNYLEKVNLRFAKAVIDFKSYGNTKYTTTVNEPKATACQLKSENSLGKSCMTNQVDFSEPKPVGIEINNAPTVEPLITSFKPKLITIGKVIKPANNPTAVSSEATVTACFGNCFLRSRYEEYATIIPMPKLKEKKACLNALLIVFLSKS